MSAIVAASVSVTVTVEFDGGRVTVRVTVSDYVVLGDCYCGVSVVMVLSVVLVPVGGMVTIAWPLRERK